MEAVLRVYGTDLDVDDLLRSFSRAKVENRWRRGDPRRGGKLETTSGITVLLAESETGEGLVAGATAALNEMGAILSDLAR